MSNAKPTVAVLFHRLGPYHFARLGAAGRLLSVVAIESSGVDETYAWDVVAGTDHFERVTLFDRADAQTLPTNEVVSHIHSALGKVQPEVVIVPGWVDPAALGALQWCSQNQVPSVIMSESTAWDEKRRIWREAVKRQIVGLGSAALVGGTPHKDYLVQLGMSAKRVFPGYDAVDNEYFADKVAQIRNQPSEVASPLEYGTDSTGQGRLHGPGKAEMLKAGVGSRTTDASTLPSAICHLPSSPFFLASARFIEKKNLPRLIQAYGRYRQLAGKAESENRKTGSTSPQPSPQGGEGEALWDLVLLGDGPLRETLNTQLSTLNLHAYVHLPGFKQYPDLPEYYARAGAFIHASTTEQWGLVVNEAMASGLPVLVSNRCGCAQDLVEDRVNGFTFDPYNVEQLAELMFKLSTLETGSAPATGVISRALAETPGGFNVGVESNSRGGCAPRLSTNNQQPSTSLAEMGAASRSIISNWGPERFAEGLQSAVRKALEVGPIKSTLLQRLILKALLAR